MTEQGTYFMLCYGVSSIGLLVCNKHRGHGSANTHEDLAGRWGKIQVVPSPQLRGELPTSNNRLVVKLEVGLKVGLVLLAQVKHLPGVGNSYS